MDGSRVPRLRNLAWATGVAGFVFPLFHSKDARMVWMEMIFFYRRRVL